MMGPMAPPRRTYTAARSTPRWRGCRTRERLRHATEIVTHAAPSLARVLDGALADGGWFGAAHEELLARASAEPDPAERLAAVRALVDEQTRVGMLVGVAVGFELAARARRELNRPRQRRVDADGDPLPWARDLRADPRRRHAC